MPNAPQQHRPKAKRTYRLPDDARPNANARGYGYRWQQTTKGYLAANPLCVECERQGQVTAATVVDHIRPHRGDMTSFWRPENWQSLCKRCHDAKTARGE